MTRTRPLRNAALAAVLALFAGHAAAAPLGTEFTYQGEVVDSGALAAGPVDLRFRLYDAAIGGVRVDAIGPFGVTANNVALVNGRFTTPLDFGAAVYAGDARWLEIDIRPAGGGAFTTLVPRQPLSAAPYARFAPNATNAQNAVNATNATNATNAANAANAATAATATNALNLGGNAPSFYTNATNITSGTLTDARLSANVALLNLAQTFSAAKTFSATAIFSNANPFSVSSSSLIANLNADLLDGQSGAFYQNASNITLGTIADTHLSANVALRNATNNFSVFNTFDGGSNASLVSGTGDLQVGPNGSQNLGIDENEIQGRNGSGGPAQLYLNNQGGNVYIGNLGTSLVGIGTISPERFFHVFGGSAGVVTSNANSLAVFEDDTNAYISLLTPAANESGILFGTPTNAQEGGIIYGNSAVGNGMQFRTNGNLTRMTLTSAGDLIINDDTSSIQFPATTAPNDAMIHMFASGLTNATRTVIGHSPGLYDEWGLTYNDTTDTFIFSQTIGGFPTLAIDMNALGSTGRVGVGTDTPLADLHVYRPTGNPELRLEGAPNTAICTMTLMETLIGATYGGQVRYDSASNQLRLSTIAASTVTDALIIPRGTANVRIPGNLGIGSTDTDMKLKIEGGSEVTAASATGFLQIGADTGLNLALDTNELQARSNGAVSTLTLNGQGGNVFIGNIATPSRVGIGDTTPDAGIDVTTSNAQVGEFDRQGTDGTIIEFQNDGIVAGSISVSGAVVSYLSFTGSHLAHSDQDLAQGELVSFTGENRAYHDIPGHEPIYGVRRTAKANDPAVLGSYLSVVEGAKPVSADNPLQIMAVGNGDMWVIDTGTNLEPGDYLISSDLPGCAMKDNPDKFPIGNIVAKSAQRVDWSKVEPGADGVRRAKISVLFNQFVRNSTVSLPADQMATLLLQQQQIIQDLEARLRVLEANR
jgi:hypothetical protein